MRFLADMSVSLTTVKALWGANHDAMHLHAEGLNCLPDSEISAKAVAETRVVLTFDLDFGDILAITRSQAPSVIIFRLRNQTPAAVNPRLFRVIAECAAELASGPSFSLRMKDSESGGCLSSPNVMCQRKRPSLRKPQCAFLGIISKHVVSGQSHHSRLRDQVDTDG